MPIALGIATAIENDGTYHVDSLTIGSDLPEVWVGDNEQVAAATQNLTGCLSLHADPVDGVGVDPGEHFLLGYVAETANDQNAALIAAGANDQSGRSRSVVIDTAAGPLCVVLIAASSITDQPSFESAESMARFRPTITEPLHN